MINGIDAIICQQLPGYAYIIDRQLIVSLAMMFFNIVCTYNSILQ